MGLLCCEHRRVLGVAIRRVRQPRWGALQRCGHRTKLGRNGREMEAAVLASHPLVAELDPTLSTKPQLPLCSEQ